MLPRYVLFMAFTESLLSENEIEILNDAIQCYGRHPEDHSYASEIDDIKVIAQVFDQHGYNKVRPEFDILRPAENTSAEVRALLRPGQMDMKESVLAMLREAAEGTSSVTKATLLAAADLVQGMEVMT